MPTLQVQSDQKAKKVIAFDEVSKIAGLYGQKPNLQDLIPKTVAIDNGSLRRSQSTSISVEKNKKKWILKSFLNILSIVNYLKSSCLCLPQYLNVCTFWHSQLTCLRNPC